MEDQQTSTPLAQLRAQAAAAKQAEPADPQQQPPPVDAGAPPPAPPAGAPAPPAAPPALAPPALAPPAAAPPAPAPAPAAPPAEADMIADLAAAEPLKPLPKPSGQTKPLLSGLLDMSTIKLGVAVMFIFVFVTGLPVDAITNKFSFLKKLPFSSTMIKAVTAGAAAATVSTSLRAKRA